MTLQPFMPTERKSFGSDGAPGKTNTSAATKLTDHWSHNQVWLKVNKVAHPSTASPHAVSTLKNQQQTYQRQPITQNERLHCIPQNSYCTLVTICS